MSKYIKLEDAINKMDEWFCEPYTPTKLLSDLPTIEVSEDCISREYMLRALNGYGKDWQEDCEIAEIIRNAPSVVPTNEQSSMVGEWIPCTKEGLPLTELGRKERQKWYGYKCSKCNFIYKGNALTESPFCQNCGADMRGTEK